MSIDLGGWDDQIEFGFDINDFVTANAAVKLNGGAGLDTFDQNTGTNAFTIAPSIVGFEVQLP